MIQRGPDDVGHLGGEFNLARVFETLASTIPERECMVWGKRRLTYSLIAERSRRLASYLHSRGLGVIKERADLANYESGQDHLAIMLYNGNEYLETMIGSYGARVAPFNVNYRYVGKELEYLLNDAKPKAIVYHASLGPTLSEVLDEVPPVEVLIQVEDDSTNTPIPGSVNYEEILASSSPSAPPVELSPDDLYILYTGGTTGMPKGVLWRQHDIFVAAMGGRRVGSWDLTSSYEQLAQRCSSGPGLKLAILPPFMHGAAQWAAFMLMADGATLVLPDDPRRLDPVDVWKTVEREKVNTMTIVGDAMLRPLLLELDRGDYDISSLFAIGNGGAPLTPAVRARALERIPSLLISDSAGSSETGAQMHSVTSAPSAHGAHRSSTPRVNRGVDHALEPSAPPFAPGPGTVVVSENLDRVLLPGHDGIGWLAQTGSVPLGYLNDPEKTHRTFPTINAERHSVPGDRARHLVDGQIELLGRDSVTVNSGGEKIFVEEVERAITGCPGVFDVVVTGRESERWGQEVVAVVSVSKGSTLTANEIVEHASRSIARYKLPKAVVFVPEVLRSPSGKADYRWARERAEESLGERGGEST